MAAELQTQDNVINLNHRVDKTLDELDHEWDTTTVVRAGALALMAAGLVLGVFRNKKYFGLTGMAAPYLMAGRASKSLPAKTLHKLHLVRTRAEIEADRQKVKRTAANN